MRCWWSSRLASSGATDLGDGDQIVARHQLRDLLRRIGGEAHVAIGEDAEQAARPGAVRDHRDAGDLIVLHQGQRIGERRVGIDRHRIDHHSRLELLHLTDRFGLFVRLQIAMDDADAAGLGHGNGEARLGHRVHCRGQDRQVETDRARQARPDVRVGGQDRRIARRQQDIVEGERFAAGERLNDRGHGANSRI